MENSFSFSKTFRYETQNEDKHPTKIIYVLHGYGQLAKFFIRKFNALADDYLIVAPEGMHRFYLNGSSGKVGASWMTKEAREIDIKDNIDWLNALDKKISSKHQINERILLGFSQGGATAIRWKMNSQLVFDKTIIWASISPIVLSIASELIIRMSSVEKSKFASTSARRLSKSSLVISKLIKPFPSNLAETIKLKQSYHQALVAAAEEAAWVAAAAGVLCLVAVRKHLLKDIIYHVMDLT